DDAKPLQKLLQQHGALMPPYHLSAAAMQRAIRNRDPVVEHEEFFDVVLGQCNAKLLDLYLAHKPSDAEFLQASGSSSADWVRQLIARGLDPARPDWLGRTLLHASAEQGDREIAALALERGADINAREVEFQGTPLAAAVRACSSELKP